jgi:hypothetical protein
VTTRNGKQSDEALRAVIERARRLAEPEPEPYRSLTFRTLLDYLLCNGAIPPEPRVSVPPAGLGLNEFLASRNAGTHPDRVLAIAYYQERYSSGPPLTTKDLVEAYQRARLKRPQNFPDVIATLVRKGYLNEEARRDGLKSWGITGTGAAHVERDL